ncbi:protein yippee-like At4g27740 [Gastrolobium bilobum]|uniref:protein yippee-like At4g27740 n=1 Tax=Gastrolobium bilobum TaxID=150636 RepID=UPI002AB0538B|nr:protein yippee-like At4g27740 [Gastrolobium bilobum]
MANFGDQSAIYRCKNCQTPIALRSELLSKSYMGKTGPAFMFSHARNIIAGPKQNRELITGLYTVAGIFCSNCGEELGWKYIQAYEARQKFKEGSFIIERARIAKEY